MKYQTIYDSPVGKLKLVSDGSYLIGLHFTTYQNEGSNFGEVVEPGIKPFPEVIRVGSVARAVGLANGQNPVAIIVPCHRVIGADGHLVGYGGGLNLKKALLNFEATVLDFGPQPFSLVPA
jgi:O-6-methylguanine DNA methyltransferase